MAIELDELAGPKGGNESRRLAKFWLDQVNQVKDNAQMKHWVKRGETIVKRYRDERNRTDEEGQRRYNALWANVEVLTPALYGKLPLPVAERRFHDKDPAGRGAAQIIERALRNEIEICGFNESFQAAVRDYLLSGRGTVWVRYEPEIEESVSLPVAPQTDMKDDQGELPGRFTPPTDQEEEVTDDTGRRRSRLLNAEMVKPEKPEEEGEETEDAEETEKLESTGDRIIRESTPVDFIEWSDFFTFPARARSWREVTAIGKRVYLSRDQSKKRFGDEIGRAIPLEKDNRGDRTQNTTLQAADEDKAIVYEIWSKEEKAIFWVSMGYDHLLDRKEDPLKLPEFFPAPRPLYANPTNNTLIPVPDFIQYQDQAIQVDELTQRIAMLTKACKMTGLYNAANKDIQRIFNESIENELIPVDDWSMFAEKGGIEGNWSLMPVQVIKDVINELMMVKEKQIEEMDRLTGINDIMRGTSDARETLGGVRLKSNNTGTRLTHRQNEVARFARDTVRIMADLMCQHFSPQSLIEISGALYEEGLGPDDMPDLSTLNGPPQGQQQPPQGQPAPSVGPMAQPPPGAPQPQGPPGAAPGSNVVPFRPPGLNPPAQQPPSMLSGQGGPPQMPAGAPPPMMPPVDPRMIAKMQALQRIGAAIQLLRNERLRGFRVDIEVDSTIFADAAQEKQDRTEFVTRVTQFLQQAIQVGAQMPEAVPMLGKLMTFAARGYRIGRDLEVSLEEFVDQAPAAIQRRMQQAAQQPNPEMLKAQTDAKKADAQIQGIQMKTQSEQMASQAEVQRQQLENQGEQANAQADRQIKQMDLAMRQMEMEIEKLRMQVEQVKAHAMIQQTHQQGQVEKIKAGAEIQTSQAKTQQAHAATQQANAATQQAQIQGQHETRQAAQETKQAQYDSEARKAEAARPPEPVQPRQPKKVS